MEDIKDSFSDSFSLDRSEGVRRSLFGFSTRRTEFSCQPKLFRFDPDY
jgi:hypothetical protein